MKGLNGNISVQPLMLAYAISRVLFPTKVGPLSFIYDGNHLSPPATYPPTLDEQSLIAGIRGLATHEAYGPRSIATLAVGSYPAFSPLPLSRRLFSVTLLCSHEHQAVNLRGALCCSDFPPPHYGGSDRARMRLQRYNKNHNIALLLYG